MPSPKLKLIGKTVMGAGLVLVVLVIAAIVLIHFLDIRPLKSMVSSAASEASGMDVRIEGRAGIGLFPGIHATMADVEVWGPDAPIITVKKIRVDIALKALLKKQVQVTRIVVTEPVVQLKSGGMPVGDEEAGYDVADGRLQAMDIDEILVTDGRVVFQGQPEQNRLEINDITFKVSGSDGVFDIEDLDMLAFRASGSGKGRADFSGEVPAFSLDFSLPGFHVDDAAGPDLKKPLLEGQMDFALQLETRGRTLLNMKQALSGRVTLQGEDIRLNGIDLDQILARYESSQHFDLVDLGAVVLAGPFGLLVTKGLDFASIVTASGDSTAIKAFVSDWDIDSGMAMATDVAMATSSYRIALKGGLDIANERFNDLVAALIDNNGCALMKQKIQGSFQDPVIHKPNMVRAIAGPALSLIKEGMALLSGKKECEAFYKGTVRPPQ